MSQKPQPAAHQSRRDLVRRHYAIPDWYGWLAVAAMALLFIARVPRAGGDWEMPLLSLGEWLLLPLGLASLTMGLLALPRLREKTLLPLWLAAIVPAVLWLLAEGLAVARHGATPETGDLLLAWVVRLIFPALAFMPLLADRLWRDRLLWALAAGMFANVAAVIVQTALLAPELADAAKLGLGGFLHNQFDYGLMLAAGLPLLAAWRGGEAGGRRSLVMVLCMFLLPSLALATGYSWAGVFAPLAGLMVAWTAWRGQGWILGVFLLLLVFGYGGEARRNQERGQRRLLVQSAESAWRQNRSALRAFVNRPFLGYGPDSFRLEARNLEPGAIRAWPWYASVLGGSGLAGLGMWLALLGELAARALGRDGRRSPLRGGGVLGAVVGLAVAGVWTEVLAPGGGALVGFVLALSLIEDPELREAGRRLSRRDPGSGRLPRGASTASPAGRPSPNCDQPGRPGR